VADGPPHDDHGAALATATALHASGDSARALELLPDLVAARPDDIEVRLLLARCLATAGVPAVALAAADAAVACDPTSWEAHALLARAALATDPDRAAAASEQAVRLAPHEPDAIRTQTMVHTARTDGPAPTEERRSGGLAAALRTRSAAPTPDPGAEPRLVPRLPAALDPTLPPAAPPPAGLAPSPAAPAVAPSPAGAVPPAADPTTAPPVSPATQAAPPAPPATPPEQVVARSAALPIPPDVTPPAGPDPLAAPPVRVAGPDPLAASPAPSPAEQETAPAGSWAPHPTPVVAPPGPVAGAESPEAPVTPTAGSVLPAGNPVGGPAAGRGELPVPVSLGGSGLAGARTEPDGDERTGPGGARLALRVFGLVTWVLVGFRYGVQVLGGPVGIALFVTILVGVAWASTKIRDL
jgi:hypothetical protein